MSKLRASLTFFLSVLCFSSMAQADFIENLSFNGYAVCRQAHCRDADGPVTGHYTLDILDATAQAIIGPFSFTLPFGTISSTDPGEFTNVLDFPSSTNLPPPYYSPVFLKGTYGNYEQEFLLIFPTVLELGPTYAVPAGVAYDDLALDDFSVKGVNTLVASTPEPSSLILLGTGILSVLGGAWKRRPPHRQQPLSE